MNATRTCFLSKLSVLALVLLSGCGSASTAPPSSRPDAFTSAPASTNAASDGELSTEQQAGMAPPEAPADAPPSLQPPSAPLNAPVRPQYESCLDNSEGVTPVMQDCIDEEWIYQDKRLNTAYRKAMSTLSVEKKEDLRTKQRAWIKYRDTFCDAGNQPGQGQVLESEGCEVEQTAIRAAELEAIGENK
jgi:uncharacterized protein YecT (DUF1311 family)